MFADTEITLTSSYLSLETLEKNVSAGFGDMFHCCLQPHLSASWVMQHCLELLVGVQWLRTSYPDCAGLETYFPSR